MVRTVIVNLSILHFIDLQARIKIDGDKNFP
jgi:hypothetical protein